VVNIDLSLFIFLTLKLLKFPHHQLPYNHHSIFSKHLSCLNLLPVIVKQFSVRLDGGVAREGQERHSLLDGGQVFGVVGSQVLARVLHSFQLETRLYQLDKF